MNTVTPKTTQDPVAAMIAQYLANNSAKQIKAVQPPRGITVNAKNRR